MRAIVILSIFLLLASCQSKKSSINSLPSLDKQVLYTALFNAEGKGEWCIWKPLPMKEDSINISTDGFCHTRLDTILFYSVATFRRAVVIFGTYEFEHGGMVFCHACNPIVSIAVAQRNKDSTWKVIKFIKNFGTHGSWSSQPDYRIGQLGKIDFLIEDMDYSNQGVTQNWTIYYHLPSLVQSLTLEDMDNSGLISDMNALNEWADSLTDVSDSTNTKVIVTRQGVSSEDEKGQIYLDQNTEYVLNDSNIFITINQQQTE